MATIALLSRYGSKLAYDTRIRVNSTGNESLYVTTYPTTRVRVKIQRSVFSWGKRVGVATNVYSRKTLKKPKRGMRVLEMRIRELFTYGEGISTLRVCHKGRQPLIECVQRDFKIIFFSLFIFLFFLGSIRVLPLLLRILRCNEEFRLTQLFKSKCLCVKLILCFWKIYFNCEQNVV